MKKLLTTLLLLSAVMSAAAQQLDANLDFRVRFDNREYKSEFSESKTLFGYKFAPEAGLKWGNDNRNRLMAGMDHTRHFGARGSDQPKPRLLLYYGYEGENFTSYAGVFQVDKLIEYPRAFVASSYKFYNPLVEGAMFRYEYKSYSGLDGFFEASCNWHGMVTATNREKFLIQSSGWLGHRADKWNFWAGYQLMMHHFSVTHPAPPDMGVVDYVIAYPCAGTSYIIHPVQLDIKAGWMQSFQNDRANEGEYVRPGGFMGEVSFKWRTLGLNNTLYLGDNMMPYYDRYGSELYLGDPFFRTDHGVYNRLEVFWQPYLRDGMSLRISTVHHYDGKTWNWQQLATFSVKLNGRKALGF